MESRSRLVTRAEEIQRSYGMSDRRFAREILEIAPSLWCMVKAGKRPPTGRFALNLIRRFPDLALLLPSDSVVVNDNRRTA
jgi:hypothetical protein